METIRRSYRIFTQSLQVLSQDKELLLFPLLSGIMTILAFGTTVFAGWTTGFFARLANADERSLEANLLGYLGLFVWYFISWFIVLFFNVAMIHCAKIRLDGGDPTVADGFRASTQHLGRIAAWALVSATVGLILRVISERAQIVGKIVSALLGAVWSIATFFIVPVMIFEKRSLRDSIKQSTQLISKTWGESLVAVSGVGLFSLLLFLPSLALPIIGMLINVKLFIALSIVMVLYWIALAVVTSALSAIFRTGLYVYATENRTPNGFNPDYVQHAFEAKGGKPRWATT